MAIGSLDAALAGMQALREFSKAITPTLVAGKPQSLWGLGGNPGAGSFSSSLAGVALSSSSAQVAGQIPHVDPVTGNAYIAGLTGNATQAGVIQICDRLWHNGGFTITSNTSQTVNSAAFPARDVNGSTNGDGVLLGLEISAAAGAAAPTITVGYTNSDGTAGRSAVNINPTANSPAAGSFFKIGLQAGDQGVRSVQSLQLSASWLSGTMNLVAYRVLASIPVIAPNLANEKNPLTSRFQRLFNGTVPFLIFIPNTTTASYISGDYVETQG